MGQGGCIRAKVVVFEETGYTRPKWLYSGKKVFFGQKLLYSFKSGCIRATVVVFGQKWSYSGKSGCIRTKLLYLCKSGCIRAKMVVFGQTLY